jgi:hypothetical protein
MKDVDKKLKINELRNLKTLQIRNKKLKNKQLS